MSVSRMAMRLAAGAAAVSVGLIGCAGLASADEAPAANVNVRPAAGISISGLGANIGVGSIKLGATVGGHIGLACAAGVGVSDGLSANVACNPSVGLGVGVSLGRKDSQSVTHSVRKEAALKLLAKTAK